MFVVLGVVIRAGTSDTDGFMIRLDDKCGDSQTCSFPFFVKSTIKGPIYVYLHFKDFYIQHRKSLKSVSYDQLTGDNLKVSELADTCAGMLVNEDNQQDFSITGNRMDPQGPLNPCGIYASLFPRDDFKLSKRVSVAGVDSYTPITISSTDIAWKSHRDNMFKKQEDGKNQWTDVTQGRDIVK